MSEHFIKNIEIKNYKLFKDFKAEGFGRVNLIGGKNNVGKTAFMEACYINTVTKNTKEYLNAISNSIYTRDYINLQHGNFSVNVESFFNTNTLSCLQINTNKFRISYEIERKNSFEKKEIFIINENEEEFINHNFNNLNVSELYSKSNHFILASIISNLYLTNLFNSILLESKEHILNAYISNLFGNEFEKFIIINQQPLIKVNNKWIELSNFGYGMKRFVIIICAMYSSKDGYFFIDEIENGVHYTLFDKLWEIILTISKEQNVQVFATTHSKECIESYARVAKRLEDYDVKYIKLSKLKDGSIYAGVRDYDMLQYVIDDEHEVR